MRIKNWLGLLLVLTVVVGIAAAPVVAAPGKGNSQGRAGGPVKEQKEFDDLDGAAWAEACISEVSAKGYMKGVGPARFGPHAALTRAMAIVSAARLADLPESASATARAAQKYSDWNQVPEWARGPIGAAAGIIPDSDSDRLMPNANATRLWAVQLILAALDLDDDAEDWDGDSLPFKDAHLIPLKLWGYVAIAAEEGIMVGDNDRTFQPHKPISRAEMAQLLCNTSEFWRNRGRAGQNEVTGVILSVNITQDRLSIRTTRGDRTVTLAANARIYLDGDEVELADLSAGMGVTVVLNSSGLGSVVNATAVPDVPAATYTGVITRLRYAANGDLSSITIRRSDNKTMTIALAADVVLKEGTSILEPDEIFTGDKVQVDVEDGYGTEVRVIERAAVTPPPADSTVTGLLIGVEPPTSQLPGRLRVTPDGGNTRYYTVADGAPIVGATWSTLAPGMRVELALANNRVVEITVLP